MIIHFRVRVNTTDKEEVYITGNSPLLGKYDPELAYKMTRKSVAVNPNTNQEETIWEAEIQFDPLKERFVFYKYLIKDEKADVTYEAGGGRRLALNSATTSVLSIDHWQENSENAPLLTDPFAHVFYGTQYIPHTQIHRKNNELIIRAVVPNVPRDCDIYLTGEGKLLGDWVPKKGIKMARLKGLKWIAYLSTEEIANQRLTYRLTMVSKEGIVTNETLKNDIPRTLTVPEIGKNETVIIEHSHVVFPPLNERYAGIYAPLSALKSEQSGGIGETKDLKLMVDWAEKVGLKIIGFYPINDSTQSFSSKDSSPYKEISSLALNPLYISTSELNTTDKRTKKEAEKEMKSLNRRATVDYEDLYAFKWDYLQRLFNETGAKTTAHPDYYKFVKDHGDWLWGYCLFCSLRDHFKTSEFAKWNGFATYSEELTQVMSQSLFNRSAFKKLNADTDLTLMEQLHKRCHFYAFLQYLLFRQMEEVITYAHSKGIALKGEFQMTLAFNSVDCWKFPQLFKGKDREGNAIYNWEAMAAEHFSWWKKRMRVLSIYADIYSVTTPPYSKEEEPLVKRLMPQLIASSNMMTWGERVPFFSITTTSEPKEKTLRMALGEKFKSISYSDDNNNTFYDATPEECTNAIQAALNSNSMFAMLPLQDWLSMDRKLRNRFTESELLVNREGNWNWRMHLTLESLQKADSLNKTITTLLRTSRRK